MKNLLIALLVLIGLSTISANGQKIVNSTIYNVKEYMEEVAVALELPETTIITVVRIPNKYDFPAFVTKIGEGSYCIYITYEKQYNSLLKILSHEMVHVHQDITGQFDITKGTSRMRYDGVLVYENAAGRKIEKEADERGNKIFNSLRHRYCF